MHAVHTIAVDTSAASRVSRPYAWLVFALTFGLLLSDYMSRQVLNAVFPILKAEWVLSDTQLGSLSGVVALLVGLLTFPLSVIADRWGRVKSITLMAALWSLATLGCALATNYGEMFAARFFVGVGEAAYGSVGIALILSIFPPHMRSTLSGAFMAGGAFGSVLGMALGGVIATQFGWRWSFGAMAIFGLLLVALYRAIVIEKKLGSCPAARAAKAAQGKVSRAGARRLIEALFGSNAVRLAYIGSGLQLFLMAAMIAWMPSYLNRYYHLATDKAGALAGIFILFGAIGMVVCGMITDRLSRNAPNRKWWVAMAYSLISSVLLLIAFQLPAGMPQLVLIGAGMFLVAGTTGPAGAMVANLTPAAIHSSAFATLTLANNLLGLAPGPFVTGVIADRIGLLGALQIIPVIALLAAAAFFIGKHYYAGDLKHIQALAS
ncbi:MFS transporter [Noviherbaspirillum sedimenti]|uniref:MFS transporter n=1 Tax=Noviherbaspirillum sedimenti TaxID=2320865 RepID=A0A3A3G927_9BURK|nr:MFS transporter [Noviherbaspirillum sedimenti]RJG04481.1 MFS transporter [Noviherbaspirillum sedimenti]